MSPLPYEELAWASTPIGEISLRKRYDRLTRRWVHEVRLGDEYLMSSQFNATEIALARLGMADEATGDGLRVVVAGLGLGFTAHEALKDPRTRSIRVVELVGAVIAWHRAELIPDTAGLAADPRCELVEADFFDLVRTGRCPDATCSSSTSTTRPTTCSRRRTRTSTRRPGCGRPPPTLGEQACWRCGPTTTRTTVLVAHLLTAFAHARAEVVAFDNPMTGGTSSCTVYVAREPRVSPLPLG